MFAGPSSHVTHGGLGSNWPCWLLPGYHTSSHGKTVICDDTSLPGAGPLSKFFQAVRREVKGYFRVFRFLEITSLKQSSQRHKIGDGKCCSSSVFLVIRPFLISHHISWRKVVPNSCVPSFKVRRVCSDHPSSIPNASNPCSLSFIIGLTRHLAELSLFYKQPAFDFVAGTKGVHLPARVLSQ